MITFTFLASDLPRDAVSRTYLETDGGGHYYVMGTVPNTVNTWFVRSELGTLWAIATVTSRVLGGNTVRVQFATARDAGDVAGTLVFDDNTFGGKGWTGALTTAGMLRNLPVWA